jgi:hypothetical protein
MAKLKETINKIKIKTERDAPKREGVNLNNLVWKEF